MRKKPLAGLLALVLSAAACSGTAATASTPHLKVAYFQGAVAGPDAVVVANRSLAGPLRAKIELRPVDSGVAGIAQLKSGAFPVISGVGNPPFVGAIANGIDVTAVYVESLDQAGLVVGTKIKSNADLIGKKVGVLVGSTLDFEFKGWLKSNGLDGKVQAASFSAEAAEDAAFKAGRLDAVYVSQAFLPDLVRHGGRVVTTAADIARLGYAAVGILAVATPYVRQHPDVVQRLVCQFSRAQALEAGPDAARYITPAAKYLGVRAQDAINSTKGFPFVPDSEEIGWLRGPDGTSATGRLAQNFALTGRFLVAQGRAKAVPDTATIARHIDPSFWVKARSGGCP
jgi:NitT/TauT family transport system substrate-binding protein